MSNRTFQLFILLVGIFLMCLKFGAWWLTNSNAILSDALESIINIAAGIFALYSLSLAAKPRDSNHPYGHGKIEFLSAGFEGALIFLAGVGIILKSGYNLWHPQELARIDTGAYITLLTGLVNFLMGYLAVRRGRRTASLTLVAGGKHLLTDAWSSFALVIGLVLMQVSGWAAMDNVVALLFGALILYTGYRLMRTSIAGIMDEADYQLIQRIVAVLHEHRRPNWIDVHNFRVIKYGNTLHIDCHLSLPWYFNVKEAFSEVKDFERLVSENCSEPVELFVHLDPCEPPQSCLICNKADCAQRLSPFAQQVAWTLDNVMADQPHEAKN